MCYNGKAVIRRVWNFNERVAFLADDEQFDRLCSGEIKGLPIGFPRPDVYQYDECVAADIVTGSSRTVDWSQMVMWEPGMQPAAR